MRAYSVRLAALATLFAVSALLVGSRVGFDQTEKLSTAAYTALLNGEPRAAMESLRALVDHNPASPYTWASLAEGLEENGDHAGAREAMLQALRRGPNIPQVRIRAANLFAEQGDPAAAARSLVVVLHRTPVFDDLVFDSFRRFGLAVRAILPLMPGDRRAARAWFYDVRQHGAAGDLKPVWDWLLPRGYADDELALSYVDGLLATRQYDTAGRDWAHYLAATGRTANSPLNWRFEPIDDVVYEPGEPLRIAFPGTSNLDFHHLSQRIVVHPGQYRFGARIRTDNLTTNHGIAFRLFDLENPGRLDRSTPQLTATNGWTTLAIPLTIPARTRLLSLTLVRAPSAKFDNKIAGTVWVGRVELTRQRAATE